MDYTRSREELLEIALRQALPGTKQAPPVHPINTPWSDQAPNPQADIEAALQKIYAAEIGDTTPGLDRLPVYEDFDTGEELVAKADADAAGERRYWDGYHAGLAFGGRQWLGIVGVAMGLGVLFGLAVGARVWGG